MNYVFYDLETTGKNKDWSQIIQFGAILVNENLQELERHDIKCNLKSGVVPEPEALLVNNNSISDLAKINFSHYELINEIKLKFSEWSPAVFFGFNSIQYDEEILRKSFFKSLLDVYITQLEGNKRGDILNIARASFFYDKNSIKTSLNLKGNISFKLEDLSKANNISHNAHDAMGDVIATIELAKILKKNAPKVWQQSLKNCYKNDVENFLLQNKIFSFLDYNFGKIKFYPLTFLCFHPKFNYPQCYNLSVDPVEIVKLSYSDLKKRIKEKPIFLKSVPYSKHPSVFEFNYQIKNNEFVNIDEQILNNRVDLLSKSEEFKEKIKLILDEQYQETEDMKPQVEILAEESLYKGGFPSYKDKSLMRKFHEGSWHDKYKISLEFEDHRFQYFAQRIIYEVSPQCLPKEIFNNIHRSIANQILTLDDVNWFTLPKAFKQIDDLREKYNNEESNQKLIFLSEINEYLEKMQITYEPAKYL